MNEKNNPGVWFEIPVTDMERAIKFYEAAFGITFKKPDMSEADMEGAEMAWFPMKEDMNTYGAAGALFKGHGVTPSKEGTCIYLGVNDLEETLKKINDAGGSTIMEPRSIGKYGSMALFEDSEGNKVAIHKDSE